MTNELSARASTKRQKRPHDIFVTNQFVFIIGLRPSNLIVDGFVTYAPFHLKTLV
jgi:hypothetical protein